MNNRLFLGKPIRNISKECHPAKITLDEFINFVRNDFSFIQQNMATRFRVEKKKQYVESWMELFLAYHEIEQEPE